MDWEAGLDAMSVGWVLAVRIEDGAFGPCLRREAASRLRGGTIPRPRSTPENDEENEDTKQKRQRKVEMAQQMQFLRHEIGELLRHDPQTLICLVGEMGVSVIKVAALVRAHDNNNKDNNEDKEKDKEDVDKEGNKAQSRRAKGAGCGSKKSALVELDGDWDWAWVGGHGGKSQEAAIARGGWQEATSVGGIRETTRAEVGNWRGLRNGHGGMEAALGMWGRQENEREREKERGKRGKWHLAEREEGRRGGYLENKKTRAGMGSWRGPRDGHGGMEAAFMKRGCQEKMREEKLRGGALVGGDMEQGQVGAAAGKPPGALRTAVVVAVAMMVVLLKAQQETAEQQRDTIQAKNMKETEREMAQEHRQTLADWIKKGGEGAGLKDD